MGEKDSTTSHLSLLSKYGTRSQRAVLLGHLGLLVLDEVSMLLKKLCVLIDVLVKQFRRSETRMPPPIGRLTIFVCW